MAPSDTDNGAKPMHATKVSAYRSAEVEGISQRDLIVMLYRGAERFLLTARVAMANHEIEPAHEQCQRAKQIFIELLATLNMEAGGDFAVRLRSLYAFFITRISEANLNKDPLKIDEILPIIAELRTGWEQIPDDLANTSSIPDQGRQGILDIST